jgi:hypothetical protein
LLGSLRSFERRIGCGSGRSIGSYQEVSLHRASYNQSPSQNGEQERVEGNGIVRRPLPKGFFVLTVWGFMGGALVVAAILGLSAMLSSRPLPKAQQPKQASESRKTE